MKRMLLVVLMLLLGAVVMVGCVDSNETTESSPSPEANITPSTTTAEQVYYFQTVDNFVEVDSGIRGPSDIFRHDRENFGETGNPNFRVSAETPSSVTLNGVAYTLETSSITVMTRSVRVAPIGVDPYGIYTDLKQFVGFDAINGTLTEFYGFEVEKLSDTQKEMAPPDLAKEMITKYFPHISVNEYELISDSVTGKTYDEVFLGQVSFRRNIKGYNTDEALHVFFHYGSLCGIMSTQLNITEDLDPSSLERIDKEEIEKIILSLIDYVRNGNKIKEPTLFDKSIVLMSDGRYAIRYEIDIQLDDPEFPWSDRISACIYLDDSKAE